MSTRSIFSLFAMAWFTAGLCGAAQPAIRLLEPAGHLSTSAATIRLTGVATGDPVANVYWVDRLGTRGPVEWTIEPGSRNPVARWTAEAPLRPGANLLTVVVVDRENRASSTQVSVYREAVAETQTAKARMLHPRGFTDSHTSLLWPLVGNVHQIPYTIENGTSNVTAAIASVNSALSIVQFTPHASEANYVTFNLGGSGAGESCQSSVGMIGGQQFISGSIDCTVGSIIHEMGHTIGLLHEHQRPDRNSWVVFNEANADKPLIAGNLDIPTTNDQVVGLYDFASVMHYPPFEFTKANLPVLESIPAGIPLGNANGFSAGDVDQINRLYGNAPSAVTVTTNPVGLQIIVDGTSYPAPQTFSWTLNSTHTLGLPPDPQFTNPPDGSTYEFGRWNDGGAVSHTIATGGGSGSLVSPANKPATTMYEANFIRLQPFAISVSPGGTGTVNVSPAPQAIFGGSFFVDRQLVTLTATPNSGENFWGWMNTPYPQGANPYPFLIQAPLTNGIAAFTTMPVTVVGEMLTGPNTWNPPLYGYVDGAFTYLPQGFSADYSGAGWTAGSSHSINAPSPNIPVTTNVSYSWNNWSDGGAITHNIAASSSGVEAVTASYTPVYRSYAYAQENCGTVQYSQSCLNNDCSFADGTSVTMTATPYSGNGMVFGGWTGDLSGLTNPDTTTIHDEFLPVANFNVSPGVITITGFTPASPVASAAARSLTINGTGFVNGSFFTYWNGGFRNSTVVSPTQATIHLNAGDLVAGGQDVEAANFSSACGAEAFYTVVVRAGTGTPRLAIVKRHQGNFTRGQIDATYTVTVTNAATATGSSAGAVTVTETVPTGLTFVSMAGTGWTCSARHCSRSDVLAPGSSYPAITVTVDVAANAPASVVNKVGVTGGDSPPATASNPTTIN